MAASVLRWAIPEPYLAEPGSLRLLARTLAIALAVRLVFMPFAAHVDLVSTYHRAYLILHDFRPRYWVPHELIEAVFLVLYSPFLALNELLGWGIRSTASFEYWTQTFVHHPQVHWALFLFKIPYLLCDLGVAAVLLRFFAGDTAKGVKAASLWLLNPIAIFSFYVFARHDSITIFFVAIALLCLQRSRLARAALALGVAIWARYYPAVFLPFLWATLACDWKRKLRTVAIALAPILVYNTVAIVTEPSAGATGGESVANSPLLSFTRSNFADYLVSFDLSMGWKQILFVFPALATLMMLYAFTAEREPRSEGWLGRFVGYCAAFLLGFYATSFFHPQYFTWFLLFLVILRAESGCSVLRNLHYLQIGMFVPYTFFWGEPLFGYLFASIDPEFFLALKSPWDWIAGYAPPEIVLNLVRSAMSATCLFMAGWILWIRRRSAPAPIRG